MGGNFINFLSGLKQLRETIVPLLNKTWAFKTVLTMPVMINDRPVKQTALTKASAHSNPVTEENKIKNTHSIVQILQLDGKYMLV